ncbi:MAG: PAS domain S-box protein [Bryobacteraceae bacterium]
MREKLLILDDEVLLLKSLEHLFEDDYEVFATTEAETAMRLAGEHDMAVILCDERMPKVSGHEFLRQVKEISRATRVMMSGYADMRALTDAVNSGQIFAYIAKPWEPLKLRAQVSAAATHFKLLQEVEQERELLRALMENIPDLIYFKDRESRFTRVNQAHARNLGEKDAADCIGKSNADYFDPENALRWRLREEQILRSGLPEVGRIEQLKDSSGGLSWWWTTKVPMFDRNGQATGIAGISRDITALKNSEEMLREQNERNRMILETAHDAFIAMDSDGTITAWNPQAERTFGWTAEEIMGRNFYDAVIAPVYLEAGALGLEHFLPAEPGSPLNRAIEVVAMHRDGHSVPVEATVWPVRAGGVYCFNAFVRDISERRRAEETRRKDATLSQLLQRVTMAANRSSSIDHTAQTCLRLICSSTGWSIGHLYLRAKYSQELISAAWHIDELVRFAAFREASDHLHRDLEGEPPGRVLASGKPEWIVNLADEKLFRRSRPAREAGLRSGFAFPVTVADDIVGVLEFFSLQTEQPDPDLLSMMGHIASQLEQVIIRQRAEEELLGAKASAELANRAKGEFLTTMSHEMRTPMNAILGMAELLAGTPLAEEQRKYVRIFQKAGANLLLLINDILDLSKVDSGHVELESIGFDLRGLLERTVEIMASRAQDRGLELTVEVLPGVPSGLVGDPNRLRQILVNLIGNALKFTERGSVILRVEPDPGGEAGWLRFEVVDTGIGIAADKTRMIFERFTQADSSTTRKYGGTGLGLAISMGLAGLMGGRMGCVSELGKGSTFFLAAPFGIREEVDVSEAWEAPAVALPPGTALPQQITRILIADDSEENIVLIEAYLQDCAFDLDTAANGAIAVEKVKSGSPHLVLMDVQMPVMDGLDATRAIRQWEARTNAIPVPILALTAHAGAEGVARSLEAGCTEHLTKPINKATLLEAVSRQIRGKIRVTPPKGIEDLIPKYLTMVRREIEEVRASRDAKDCNTALRVGHQLKGSGESYGFPEISRTGGFLERAAIAANQEEIQNQILALAAYLDRVEIVA